MSDPHGVTTSPQGPPSGPRRRRVALLVLTGIALAALVSVLITVVRDGSVGWRGGAASAPTIDPGQRSDDEAAVRHGWRLVAHDEFDGTALDRSHWSPYSGRTTGGVGQHDPANLSVSSGTLRLTSRGNTSAGLEWNDGQLYGRWEARVRSQPGTGYGPVLLLWPDAEDWPEGGEIDFLEIPEADRQRAHFTVHWGAGNHQAGRTLQGDFTQWHTVAVEWLPDRVVGYLDGQEIYRTTKAAAIPPRSMHLAIQQDIGPYGTDWLPAPDASTPPECTFEVDWVRIYAP